jgi:hypothetical protein
MISIQFQGFLSKHSNALQERKERNPRIFLFTLLRRGIWS